MAGKTKEARVLVDCEYGNCGDVVSLEENEIKAGENNGRLDSTPAAVSYAKALIKKARQSKEDEVVHEE